jgi:hypothetical protein
MGRARSRLWPRAPLRYSFALAAVPRERARTGYGYATPKAQPARNRSGKRTVGYSATLKSGPPSLDLTIGAAHRRG